MKKIPILPILIISSVLILLFLFFLKNQSIPSNDKLLGNVSLTIPESTTVVNFDLENSDSVVYEEGEGEFVEHGSVKIYKNHITPLSNNEYASFMAVDRGGSGTEIYLVVFAPENEDYIMIASVFLGDRVVVKSLSVSDANDISVSFMEHGRDQAMAEEPSVLIEKTFMYEELMEKDL